MSTMVDRVALAIFCAREGLPEEQWVRSRGPWKMDYLKEARAAIRAMSGPTPEMTAVISMGINADQVWRSMIQAALKEQE